MLIDSLALFLVNQIIIKKVLPHSFALITVSTVSIEDVVTPFLRYSIVFSSKI